MLKIFQLLCITSLFFHMKAHDYAIVGDDMSFIQPCDESEDDGTTKLGELVTFYLNHDYAEDMETIVSNGNITINVGIPAETQILGEMEIYKWERGHWVNTVFSIKRPDSCAAIFDPSEFWYPLVAQLPEEDRVCPPPKDRVFIINDMKNRLELKNVNVHGDLSGKYKATIHFTIGNYSSCLMSVVNVWII
ncbi:uncharacterized protein LOC131802247 [Musca domestica]|uniref:Uncharacterized protein LOC131802247 n=1 Tax=Musca domestica TaxID=7370 RepID=A0A1I8N200_MUSDO|nr:uncharacterized protein LOC131802247 [Musca domestica]